MIPGRRLPPPPQAAASRCRSLAASAALLVAAAAPARAQLPEDVTLRAQGSITRFVLDVPPWTGDEELDRLMRRVLRDDLFFSGLFEFVPEGAAAPYRLDATIEPGERFVVTYTLRETADGRVLSAKRFRGSEDSARRVAHRIAEEVVRTFTGRGAAFDTRIAFVSDSGDRRDVHVMDYDGANVHRVTNDGAIALSPEVSPDGQHLIFTSYVSRQPAVYLIHRQTGEIRKLLFREGLNQSPAWSPDGTRLALSAAFEGNSEIYVSDLSGKDLRRLTDTPAIDVSPAWSPTGNEIAFQSDRSGTPQVHVMSADGLDVRRVTLEGAYNGEPAWSPDGTTLAYSSRQGGRFQICLLDVATGAVTTLTDGRSNNESPSWSPDGEFLAFSSDREGKYDIWIMRRDGQAARRVGTRGENRFPHWYR